MKNQKVQGFDEKEYIQGFIDMTDDKINYHTKYMENAETLELKEGYLAIIEDYKTFKHDLLKRLSKCGGGR